jgi:apolipoprotein N-acyltransferase
MQPNLPQDEKFNYSSKQEVMRRYLSLSDRSTGPQSTGMRDVTHLIWPESAFPFFLTREADALAQIAALLPQGSVLITGAARFADSVPARGRGAYNSVYVIDHEGTVLSVYDKVHLVPFGEYLPFQDLLEKAGLVQLTKVRGGFLSGDRHRSYNVPGAPRFLPLICYEIIFPGQIVPAGERPAWLLNVTNDAWFGISTGPHQHFRQARIRAIEEGLPLVRAANNGISAVVDPAGRILRSLPLGAEGVLDSQLPRPIAPPLYSRIGDSAVGLLMGALFVFIIRNRSRRKY